MSQAVIEQTAHLHTTLLQVAHGAIVRCGGCPIQPYQVWTRMKASDTPKISHFTADLDDACRVLLAHLSNRGASAVDRGKVALLAHTGQPFAARPV